MSPNGRYVTSKIPSQLVSRFGNCNRANINNKSFTPGPGSYRVPSEFGHYIARSEAKNTESRIIKNEKND